MSSKFNILFSETECPENGTLLDYANNKLGSQMKHTVEMHLADCEMCRDELEGIMQMKDVSQLSMIVRELNHKIKRFVEKRKPKFVWIDYRMSAAIAAVMLSVIVLAIYVILNVSTKNNSEMATAYQDTNQISKSRRQANKELNNSQNKKDEIHVIADNKVKSDKQEKKEEIAKTKMVESEIDKQGEVKNDEDKTINENIIIADKRTNISDSIQNFVSNEGNVAKDSKLEVDDIQKEKFKQVESTKKSKVFEKSDSKTGLLELANEKYKIKDYSSALTFYNQALILNKNNHEALFYSGMCYYYQKKYTNAIHFFDSIIKDINSKYFEDALWYKAEIQIFNKDIESAKSLLNQIIQLNKKYKTQAEKKLKDL